MKKLLNVSWYHWVWYAGAGVFAAGALPFLEEKIFLHPNQLPIGISFVSILVVYIFLTAVFLFWANNSSKLNTHATTYLFLSFASIGAVNFFLIPAAIYLSNAVAIQTFPSLSSTAVQFPFLSPTTFLSSILATLFCIVGYGLFFKCVTFFLKKVKSLQTAKERELIKPICSKKILLLAAIAIVLVFVLIFYRQPAIAIVLVMLPLLQLAILITRPLYGVGIEVGVMLSLLLYVCAAVSLARNEDTLQKAAAISFLPRLAMVLVGLLYTFCVVYYTALGFVWMVPTYNPFEFLRFY